jgi:hypothetical protein
MELEEEKLILRDLSMVQDSLRATIMPIAKVKMAANCVSGFFLSVQSCPRLKTDFFDFFSVVDYCEEQVDVACRSHGCHVGKGK